MVQILILAAIVVVGFIAFLMLNKPAQTTQKDIAVATGGLENLGADIGQQETDIVLEEGRQVIEGQRILLDDAQTLIEKSLTGEIPTMQELVARVEQSETVQTQTHNDGTSGGTIVNVTQPSASSITTKALGASLLTPEQDPKEIIAVGDFLKEKNLSINDFENKISADTGRRIITIGSRDIPLVTTTGLQTKFQRQTLEGLLAQHNTSTT